MVFFFVLICLSICPFPNLLGKQGYVVVVVVVSVHSHDVAYIIHELYLSMPMMLVMLLLSICPCLVSVVLL